MIWLDKSAGSRMNEVECLELGGLVFYHWAEEEVLVCSCHMATPYTFPSPDSS